MTAVNLNRAVRGPVTAVPIVAGKGVRLVADTQNNRWVVEADETVLWEGSANTGMTLSESVTNFDEIKVYYDEERASPGQRLGILRGRPINSSSLCVTAVNYFLDDSGNPIHLDFISFSIANNVATLTNAISKYSSNSGTGWGAWDMSGSVTFTKIVGINRIASN